MPRCRRCRFGDTAASGAGTNGFRAKGTRNQRFARTAKARIGIGRDNRRCPLLTSDVENDLDCPRTFSSVVHKQSALVAIGGRARQVSNLRHWDYRTPLYPLRLRAHRVVGFGLRRPGRCYEHRPDVSAHLFRLGDSGDAFRHSPTASPFRLSKTRHFCRVWEPIFSKIFGPHDLGGGSRHAALPSRIIGITELPQVTR